MMKPVLRCKHRVWKSALVFGFFLFMAAALHARGAERSPACGPAGKDGFELEERIEFGVKWWFVPILDTYMETYRQEHAGNPAFFLLTHQAEANAIWNDRMESVIHTGSLMPCRMETTVDDEGKKWKDRILFQRNRGRALLSREDRMGGGSSRRRIPIAPDDMDPLSAFYYLRKRISSEEPNLELSGITDSRRFSLSGDLVGEENIEVPAGKFSTYRLECTMEYWPQGGGGKEPAGRKKNRFTMWVSLDQNRFPVQIRYRLPVGSLLVKASSVKSYPAAD